MGRLQDKDVNSSTLQSSLPAMFEKGKTGSKELSIHMTISDETCNESLVKKKYHLRKFSFMDFTDKILDEDEEMDFLINI